MSVENEVQTGHEGQVPRGAVIVLSPHWIEAHTSEQLDDYIRLIRSVTENSSGKSPTDIEPELRHHLSGAGLELDDIAITRTAEQIASANAVQIMSGAGKVLYSPQSISVAPPAQRDPGVHGTEDPDHPDRPTLGA